MGLFGKKKDIAVLNIVSGSSKDNSSNIGNDIDENPTLSKQVLKLRMDVDSLNAQIIASSELRKVSNERFAAIQESIGEIKNQLIEKDKIISKIQSKAEKASTLVETVKPEQFMIELKKMDAKVMAIKGKIENTESIFNTVLEEMKTLRQKISVFKGVEDIIKLNEEIRKELNNVQQVEARVSVHSDRVEGIFIEAQKKFNQFKNLDDKIKTVSDSLRELTGTVNEDKGKLQTFASKDEILDLKNSYESVYKKIDFILKKKGIDISKVSVDENVIDYDSKINDLTTKLDEQNKKIEQMLSMLEEFVDVSNDNNSDSEKSRNKNGGH